MMHFFWNFVAWLKLKLHRKITTPGREKGAVAPSPFFRANGNNPLREVSQMYKPTHSVQSREQQIVALIHEVKRLEAKVRDIETRQKKPPYN